MGSEPEVNHDQISAAGIERTDQRFGGIRTQGFFRGEVSPGLVPQLDQRIEIELETEFCESAVADELGSEGGTSPHAEIGMVSIDEFGCSQTQHRITEKLQTFVVPGLPGGNMSEGLIHAIEQRRADSDPRNHPPQQALQLVGAGGLHRGGRTQPSESPNPTVLRRFAVHLPGVDSREIQGTLMRGSGSAAGPEVHQSENVVFPLHQ